MKPKALEVGTLVRQSLQPLLDASPAYRSMQPDAQRTLADNMARIGAYLVQPEEIRANHLPGALAMVPAEAAGITHLLADVNFPQFVADLIQGVFHAIVNSSVQQMATHSKLVKKVAHKVNQINRSSIPKDNARD